ncbi:MAG: hydrogenase expression protein [Armatimonadetes bacterium]|nr:hydrogenase expression protein [Armatimonadota bacterium]
MEAGKLPPELLARLLAANRVTDPRVLVGPAPGEDAAAIDMGDRVLVAKTDPITFATDEIGWYAVNVNANDVATMGAVPRWFLASVLLPEGAPEALAEGIFGDIVAACRNLGISLVGGHTEITYGLPRPVVVGCLLGEVERDGLVTSSGARPGDALVLTKGIAVEGTALLAREARAALAAAGLPGELLERAAGFLRLPGISVVRDARIACECGGVHALHDPTEGGLITGLRELAAAAGGGLRVDADAIPIFPETRAICEALKLDPLGLIASGALLAAVPPERASALLEAYRSAGVPAAAIGELTVLEEGFRLERAGRREPLPLFARDEIARYFAKCG